MVLVECVPNFSEGRDDTVLEALGRAIQGVSGVRLLDIHRSPPVNRSVFTLAGPPGAVGEAAFAAIRTAVERIDLRRNQGLHPRVGAADVCPFVPLRDATMAECITLARQVGQRVGEELQVPVYLYEAAASRPGRAPLPAIRRGGLKGLAGRLSDPAWQPDYGPPELNPSAGACVIGARKLLIAFNLSLDRADDALAREIAAALRDGALRAIGWTLPEPAISQVSCNLTDLDRISLHEVFAAGRDEAARRGARITGSEIVGLVPLAALREAGRVALSTADIARGKPGGGLPPGASDAELVAAAVRWLGLQGFDPARRILEWALAAAP